MANKIERKDSIRYQFVTNLGFPSPFKTEGDSDLEVKRLNVQTSGDYDGEETVLTQRLVGSGMSQDSSRGLNGSLAIAYREIISEPITPASPPEVGIFEAVLGEHDKVINAIQKAYQASQPLPKKIGSLEFIA